MGIEGARRPAAPPPRPSRARPSPARRRRRPLLPARRAIHSITARPRPSPAMPIRSPAPESACARPLARPAVETHKKRRVQHSHDPLADRSRISRRIASGPCRSKWPTRADRSRFTARSLSASAGPRRPRRSLFARFPSRPAAPARLSGTGQRRSRTDRAPSTLDGGRRSGTGGGGSGGTNRRDGRRARSVRSGAAERVSDSRAT